MKEKLPLCVQKMKLSVVSSRKLKSFNKPILLTQTRQEIKRKGKQVESALHVQKGPTQQRMFPSTELQENTCLKVDDNTRVMYKSDLSPREKTKKKIKPRTKARMKWWKRKKRNSRKRRNIHDKKREDQKQQTNERKSKRLTISRTTICLRLKS